MKFLTSPADWMRLQKGMQRTLPSYLLSQRWFGGKTRTIRSMLIVDAVPIPLSEGSACIFLQRVDYDGGTSETYVIPFLERESGAHESLAVDGRPTLRIQTEDGELHLLSDALWDTAFLRLLLDALSSGRRFFGVSGELVGLPTQYLKTLFDAADRNLEPSRMKAEQSNTSILYGRSLVLKFFRRMEPGVNPDYEIGEFLSQQAGFSHVPAMAGALEYRDRTARTATLGILQAFVANQGDAWQETLKALAEYYDRVAKRKSDITMEGPQQHSLLTGVAVAPSSLEIELLGKYHGAVHLLGQRTAELHLALASDRNNADFAPESFSGKYQQTLYESMTKLTLETLGMLRGRTADLPPELKEKARSILSSEDTIVRQFRFLRERPLTGLRTRVHGDFHLGQVLCADDDFVFIDFEGEPVRTLAERRGKHSPLRDIAGMLRSFHYAAYAALFQRNEDSAATGAEMQALWPFANVWYIWAATEYLRGYLTTASGADFLPSGDEELGWFLNILLLEKAVYELKYELGHRLSWVRIPLEGIHELIAPSA